MLYFFLLLMILYFYLEIDFVSANSTDPDEITHALAFHLSLHCLLMYQFKGFPYTVPIHFFFKLRFNVSYIDFGG